MYTVIRDIGNYKIEKGHKLTDAISIIPYETQYLFISYHICNYQIENTDYFLTICVSLIDRKYNRTYNTI